MNRQLLLLLGYSVLVSGCDKPPDPSHLVSWWSEHDDERKVKMTWCADDAERRRTIDCQNAEEAQRRKQVGSQSTLKPIDWGAKTQP